MIQAVKFAFFLKTSSSPPRLQNLLQILPTILMRCLMVMQLLLQIRDLSARLGTLTRKTLINRVDGDIDEPAVKI